jgi:hypothetical protein
MSRRSLRSANGDLQAEEMTPVEFDYRLKFDDGTERTFLIQLDPQTLAILRPEPGPLPEWTDLQFCQCSNCTLDPAVHPQCPVAASMVDLVDCFKDCVSHEAVEVTVQTAQRGYFLRTSVQNALSSITGIYMTTAGCPIMDRLRPMVETHLPFATQEETTYRTVSMYLFAQFALERHEQKADWGMSRLMEFLREVGKVNMAFCERLNSIPHRGDAHVNALTILDSLASLTSIRIEGGRLEHWETLLLRQWGA